MWKRYLFEVAVLSCQNPLQAAPEPGTGFLHQRAPGDDTKDHDGGGKLVFITLGTSELFMAIHLLFCLLKT